jgi:signal transduction histidine kinase
VFDSNESINLLGDERRIHQVILNLINNALKFIKKGIIKINSEKDDRKDKVIITVADTGTDIDKDVLPQIFTKFVSKSKSGTGLGLFISKAVVQAHGGQIQAFNGHEEMVWYSILYYH